MAEASTQHSPEPPGLPSWLIRLCCWFWKKHHRVLRGWTLLGTGIASLVLYVVGVLLQNTPKTFETLPLASLLHNVTQNWSIYTLILLGLFFLLLFLTLASFLVYHVSSMRTTQQQQIQTTQTVQIVQLEQEDEQTGMPQMQDKQRQEEHNLRKKYLRVLQQQVHLLPSLGLGVSDLTPPHNIHLADVFIPMEFRLSPKALRQQPLNQDEFEALKRKTLRGLDPRHEDYLLVDDRGEWERALMQRERVNIAKLWDSFALDRPAIVIQGDPGIGKSTLLSRITLSLARQGLGEEETQLPLTPTLLPLLIYIREYADYLKGLPPLPVPPIKPSIEEREKRSLLSFLIWDSERKLREKGVEQSEQVAGAIRDWLNACSCLIMFDGLDEVSDQAQQLEIQQAIHDFIEQQRHPDREAQTFNRFLITSRIAEFYAPALEGYRYFVIADLSREQIIDFLPRWYKANISSDPGKKLEEEKERAERLTTKIVNALEREAVLKLTGNPLVLTLMAVMLYNGWALPERRGELYSAVTKTLLERWNAIKGLPEFHEDEAIQRLGPLAFAMQGKGNSMAHRNEVEAALREAISSLSGSGGLSEEQVTVEVKNYLMEFARRGGIFFLRTGDYYSFIHRSFQEYFAACFMLREIESNREEKIKDYVQIVRDNPNIWREPFIFSVAVNSERDSGLVADEMLRELVRSEGGQPIHDTLLAAQCIIESNFVNLDRDLQRDIAERLLSLYEQEQKVLQFQNCQQIEQIIRDWLSVLRENEQYLELPHALLAAIRNTNSSEHQHSTLTLLAMIATQLQSTRYNIYSLLIPSLLALAGLESIGNYQPDTSLSESVNFDIADLASTVLSFMGKRGPAALMLQEVRQHFKQYPQHLRDLARYSLESKTLITPTLIPLANENYNRYELAIEKWTNLAIVYWGEFVFTQKRSGVLSEQQITECANIHQVLLDCAEEASYPTARLLLTLLDHASSQPDQWRTTWQEFLLARLKSERYVHYQEAAIYWSTLFPDKSSIQLLKNTILKHFNNSTGNNKIQSLYAQRFLSHVTISLRYINNLRRLTQLKAINRLGLLSDLNDLNNPRYLNTLKYIINLIDIKSDVFKDDMKTLSQMRYISNLRYMSSISNNSSMNKLLEQTKLVDLMPLLYRKDLIHLKELSSLIFNHDLSISVIKRLSPTSDRSQMVDILYIVTGRLLLIQENKEIGDAIEAEAQQLAKAAFTHQVVRLLVDNMDGHTEEAFLDVFRYLPTRTVNEIQFVLQTAKDTAYEPLQYACAYALQRAEPTDDSAWHLLEQEKVSPVPVIRVAIEEKLRRRS